MKNGAQSVNTHEGETECRAKSRPVKRRTKGVKYCIWKFLTKIILFLLLYQELAAPHDGISLCILMCYVYLNSHFKWICPQQHVSTQLQIFSASTNNTTTVHAVQPVSLLIKWQKKNIYIVLYTVSMPTCGCIFESCWQGNDLQSLQVQTGMIDI